MDKSILICGVGGQGTVLASKLIASAAIKEGHTVHSAETIGMAQRGGPVTSHVRIGDKACSPLIPLHSADVILAFEPAEAVRNISYLKKNGVLVINSCPVMPTGSGLSDVIYDASEMTVYLSSCYKTIIIDSADVCMEFSSSKFFNIIILGVAAGAGLLSLSKEILTDTITATVPKKYTDTNIKAFNKGYAIGGTYAIKQHSACADGQPD